MVLPESLVLTLLTFPRSTGVSRNFGASLSLENVWAISSVGCRQRIGDGS